MPTIMNAANEIAVENFCAGKLAFQAMPALIEAVMDTYSAGSQKLSIDKVLETDQRARAKASELLDAGL